MQKKQNDKASNYQVIYMFRLRHSPYLTLLLIFLVAALQGCKQNDKTDIDNKRLIRSLQSSEAYFKNSQYKPALIEAANALQASPSSEKATLQLAKIYNILGNYQTTLNLLSNKDLPKTPDIIAKKIETYISLKKPTLAKITLKENTSVFQPDSTRQYQFLLGLVAYEHNEWEVAEQHFLDALNAQPENLQSLIALAKVKIAQKELDSARHYLAKASAIDSTNIDILITSAIVANNNGDLESAEKNLTEALNEVGQGDAPTVNKIHILHLLSDLLLRQNKPNEALIYSELTAKASPKGAEVSLKLSEIEDLIRGGKIPEAEIILLKLYESYNDAVTGTALAMISFLNGDAIKADAYFRDNFDPENAATNVKQAYVLNQIQLNQPQKILGMLEAALQKQPKDPKLLSTYGLALLAAEDESGGLKAINESLAIAPDNTELRLALARYYNHIKNFFLAHKQAEIAYQHSPDNKQTHALYASTLLNTGQAKKSIKLAEQLIEKHPQDIDNYFLAGRILMTLKKTSEAASYWEKSLTIDAEALIAHYALGEIALIEKNSDQALFHYLTIIDKDSTQGTAYKGVLAAYELNTDIQAGIKKIQSLTSEHPAEATPLAVLAEYQLRRDNIEAALPLAKKAIALDPSLSYAVKLNELIHYQLSVKQLAAKNFNAARQSLGVALKSAPRSLDFLKLQADIEIATSNHNQLEQVLVIIDEHHPNTGLANALKGDSLIKQQAYDAALSQYQTAWKKQPNDRLALKISSLLKRDGNKVAQDEFYGDWIQALPNAIEPYARQAQRANAQGDRPLAISLYEAALLRQPESLLILNNLAWAYHLENQPRARLLAEKAYKLAPENVALIDTYAAILLKEGNKEQSIQLLEKALRLAPEDEVIQKHLDAAKVSNDHS